MRIVKTRHLVGTAAVLLGVASLGTALVGTQTQVGTTLNDFFLPGTQPGFVGDPIFSAQDCDSCHSGMTVPDAPSNLWRASMMAQAARDPMFHAGLAIANQDADFGGELCIRCHSPGGWLNGRSTPTDGSALFGQDFEGITCLVCHRSVDPIADPANPTEDAAILADLVALGGQVPTMPHSGTIVMDPNDRRRGPFDLDADWPGGFFFHQWLESPWHQESLLCATCHDVSNPAYERVGGMSPSASDTYALSADDAPHPDQNKYNMFPIERTYSEWSQSEFALGPVEMGGRFGGNKTAVSSCQDCHVPDTTAEACVIFGAPTRDDMPQHYFLGVNNWVQQAVLDLDAAVGTVDNPFYGPGEESTMTQTDVDTAIALNEEFLTKAADVELSVSGDDLTVRVVNQGGHKLPSGYHEGRRVWLNVRFLDSTDTLVEERGAYDPVTAVLTTANTKVYEAKFGIDAAVASATGLPVGETLHFVLNNTIEFDNRIPPRGFTNAGFESVQAKPVGVSYADGQHWDDTVFDTIPCNAVKAEVRLFYQVTSKEYAEFLRDENTTNTAGQIAYDLWEANGKSPPVQMNLETIEFDCNGNGVLDHCDIQMGTSFDADMNGVPDECEPTADTPSTSTGTPRAVVVRLGGISPLRVGGDGFTPRGEVALVDVTGLAGRRLRGRAGVRAARQQGLVLWTTLADDAGDVSIPVSPRRLGDATLLQLVDVESGRFSNAVDWR